MESMDVREFTQLSNAVHAVAKNINSLTRENQERVLLAVAVLYGIITPTVPKVRPPRAKKKPTRLTPVRKGYLK